MKKRFMFILPAIYLFLYFVVLPQVGEYGDYIFYLNFPLGMYVGEAVKNYVSPYYPAVAAATIQYFLIGLFIDWAVSRAKTVVR